MLGPCLGCSRHLLRNGRINVLQDLSPRIKTGQFHFQLLSEFPDSYFHYTHQMKHGSGVSRNRKTLAGFPNVICQKWPFVDDFWAKGMLFTVKLRFVDWHEYEQFQPKLIFYIPSHPPQPLLSF